MTFVRWKTFDLPIPPMTLAHDERQAITSNILGTIIDDRIRRYSERNAEKRTLIIKNHPAAPTPATITYALLTHYPNVSINEIPQLLQNPRQDIAVAYTPDHKPPTLTGNFYPAWIYLHFPEDLLLEFEHILKIMDDPTWQGTKYTPNLKIKIHYHRHIGYRAIAPRYKSLNDKVVTADWYFRVADLIRKYDYQPIWFAWADPERWQWIFKTADKHPWTRPTPGGLWYVSRRPGDPTTPQELEQAYRRLLHYPRPKQPQPPPVIRAETRPTHYEIDPDDPDTPEELKPRERAIKTQSPFHLPKFTDEEWEKKHEDYIKRHGYEIRIPNWDDIFHIKLPPKTTDQDYQEYKAARKEGRPPRLPPEVVEYFDKRREKYKRYLGTPQPKWYRSYTSILTALDDAQDALSAATLLGQLAIRAAPRALSRLVGPLAWTMTATELLNLANKTMRAPWTPKRAKRRLHDMVRENPFAKLVDIKDPGALAGQINWIPRLIELGQVVDSLFGVGLCIGPLFGTAADIAFGGIRALSGEPVSLYLPGQDKPALVLNASKNLKSAHAAAITNPILDDEDRLMITLSVALSANVLRPYLQGAWKEARIPNTKDLIITAPKPRKPDTIDLLREAGIDPDDTARLPLLDVKEALYDEWALEVSARITSANDLHMVNFQNPDLGYLNAVFTYHAALSTIAAISRPGSIELRIRPDISLLMRLLDAGWRPSPYISEQDFNRTLLAAMDKAKTRMNPPHTRDIPTPAWIPREALTNLPDPTYPAATALTKDQIAWLEDQARKDRSQTQI